MKTCGIIWIESNKYRILKSTQNIITNVFTIFSIFKGLNEMLSK
jgi:hypothetical protein